MTFQIIDKNTNEPINLIDFDNLYCKELGIEPHKRLYAQWFYSLENVLLLYGDLADNGRDTSFVKYRLRIRNSRTISFIQVGKLVQIVNAMFQESPIEDLEIIVQVANFFYRHEEEYYIKFSF